MKEVIKMKSWTEDPFDLCIKPYHSNDESVKKYTGGVIEPDLVKIYIIPAIGEKTIKFNYDTCRFEKIEKSPYKVELI